jgi:hypothetical protein
MYSHSFHQQLYPTEDWNEFFWQSNHILAPMEICDCERNAQHTLAIERRYFWDKELDNKLVYINLNGKEGTGDDHAKSIFGRLNASLIFSQFDRFIGVPFGFSSGYFPTSPPKATKTSPEGGLLFRSTMPHSEKDGNDSEQGDARTRLSGSDRSIVPQEWEVSSWGEVIQRHVGALGLDDRGHAVPVVMNAGFHKHNFPRGGPELFHALNATNMMGIWKTTTYSSDDSQYIQTHNNNTIPQRAHDQVMCSLLSHCLNLSWTAHLDHNLYIDQLHFQEPTYRIMNEDLMKLIGVLPSTYQTLDRQGFLHSSSHMDV